MTDGGARAHLRPLLPRRADGRTAGHRPRAVDRQVARRPARRHDRRRERAGRGHDVHGQAPAPAARRGRAAAARGAARPARARRRRRARHRAADRRATSSRYERRDRASCTPAPRRSSACARALRRDDARHPHAGHERLRGAASSCAPTPSCAACRWSSSRSPRAARRSAGEWAVAKPIDAERAGRRARRRRSSPAARACSSSGASPPRPRLEPSLERSGSSTTG